MNYFPHGSLESPAQERLESVLALGDAVCFVDALNARELETGSIVLEDSIAGARWVTGDGCTLDGTSVVFNGTTSAMPDNEPMCVVPSDEWTTYMTMESQHDRLHVLLGPTDIPLGRNHRFAFGFVDRSVRTMRFWPGQGTKYAAHNALPSGKCCIAWVHSPSFGVKLYVDGLFVGGTTHPYHRQPLVSDEWLRTFQIGGGGAAPKFRGSLYTLCIHSTSHDDNVVAEQSAALLA